jgi:hypothetical protein
MGVQLRVHQGLRFGYIADVDKAIVAFFKVDSRLPQLA